MPNNRQNIANKIRLPIASSTTEQYVKYNNKKYNMFGILNMRFFRKYNIKYTYNYKNDREKQ